jgi:hypothetical protein
MLRLCIGELADIVGGKLTLGSLPPLAGVHEPVYRIVVDSCEARPGDVYWALTAPDYDGVRLADDAYQRGALGVVASGRHVEPWAGRFSLEVSDANAALRQLVDHLPKRRTNRHPSRNQKQNTTRMVQAMLDGDPVPLEAIIERFSTAAETLRQTKKEILEVPPSVS